MDVTFTYLLCVKKKTHEIEKNKHGILGNIQAYYGCYETTLNGSLHKHTLLWNANPPSPNELVIFLKNDKQLKNDLLKYLDNIISRNILTFDP